MSEIQISGQTIYELDPDGVNRWSANIQPGTGLDGFRQPNAVIDRVAKRLYTADLYHERLVEALRELEQWFSAVGLDHIPNDVYHDRGGFAVSEKARKLLNELDT